ncbi:unnamed protein product [Closterium sp. NIES-53]
MVNCMPPLCRGAAPALQKGDLPTQQVDSVPTLQQSVAPQYIRFASHSRRAYALTPKSGGAEPRCTASCGGPVSVSPRLSPWPEPLSPQQLREWFARRTRLWSGAARAVGSTAGDAGAGGTGGTGVSVEMGERTPRAEIVGLRSTQARGV